VVWQIRLGWSKAVPIPAQPVYQLPTTTAANGAPVETPAALPSVLPFHAFTRANIIKTGGTSFVIRASPLVLVVVVAALLITIGVPLL
jgi:hypothetical protein